MKIIFKQKGNEILMSDTGMYYLRVRPKKGKERVYWFDGVVNGNQIAKQLQESIESHGAFYINMPAIAPKQRTKDLTKVLYGMYHNIDNPEQVKALKPAISNKRPLTGLKDFNFFHGDVYDMRVDNIHSLEYSTNQKSDFSIVHTAKDIIICKDGKYYFTGYQDGLYKVLKSVTCWNAPGNNLRAVIHGKEVSFSVIVWAYYHGMMDGEAPAINKIARLYGIFLKNSIVVDHTTENTQNNYIWALAKMEHGYNAAFSNYRTRISAPIHFYLVFDYKRKQYRVECGLSDYGFTKRYIFEESDIASVLECFNTVKRAAQKMKLFEKKPSRTSALRYWSDPTKADDLSNPLIHLLEREAGDFTKYSTDELKDFTKILKQFLT